MRSFHVTSLVLVLAAATGCHEKKRDIPPVPPSPAVAAITPSFGLVSGGTVVTLTGANFVSGATVTLGGNPATSVTFVSGTELTATTPSGSAGVATVVVTNPDTRSGALAAGFTYVLPVAPAFGPTAGGTSITITGSGFQSGATVTVGGVSATSVTFLSAFRLTAVTPGGAAGAQTVVATNPGGQTTTYANAFIYDDAPGITTSLTPYRTAFVGETLAFSITVSDPNSDPISLQLLNPPPGCDFAPLTAAPTPATANVRWNVPARWGGLRWLIFQASDNLVPALRTTLAVPVQVLGNVLRTPLVVADVTGDGILDVVGGASSADLSGKADVGAVYVWAGQTAPSGTPTATLRLSAPVAGDRLGIASGQEIQCADVTGDGVLDVVVSARYADIGGTTDAGAVFVWAGGSGLLGSVSPTATLRVVGAVASDELGAGNDQTLLFSDVTGDGTVDIVVGAANANVGGSAGAGAVYVWAGGSGITGTISPIATLRVPGATVGDRLGDASGQGILCADVTGDGTLDVVVGAASADIGGTADTGAAYVWAGGSGLAGTPSPTATLRVAGAVTIDLLGSAAGPAIQCADVTGDGTLDVVIGAASADVGGTANTGSVYMWAGGTGLTGTLSPTATLQVTSASIGDALGWIGGGTQQAIHCVDVTGDGTLDIVVGASRADVGGTSDTGAVYVWTGGSGLTGTLPPTAILRVVGAAANDQLGTLGGNSQPIQCADVTGDAILDIVVGTWLADVGGTSDTGAVYVWAGGSGLTGTLGPTATLRIAGAVANDWLGASGGAGDGAIQCADLTGDGTLDIVVGADFANVGGTVDTGAVYIWAGGSSLTGTLSPTATLRVAGATASDQLGSGGIRCADVTGDGVPDAVVGALFADIGGTADTGAVYVWAGGSGLSGTISPTATLRVAGASAYDAVGWGVLCAEVTGDGTLDVVAGAQNADVGGTTDAGAVYVWAGGSGLTGTVSPTATLRVVGASTTDSLGSSNGEALQCADITGDGVLDIVVGTSYADIGGSTDAGAIYFWTGGWGLVGTLSPTTPFAVPAAAAGDQLGS